MKQYLELLKAIRERGTHKPAAREGMPGSTSLFGYQLRHNLADGFPLLTTKRVSFKNIVTELIWFLNGNTDIKYLVDRGCNIWNEDAYNYYLKQVKALLPITAYDKAGLVKTVPLTFEEFIEVIKGDKVRSVKSILLGDCGYQYGKTWRDFNGVDQITRVISSLKNNPESRRHIVTAIDPSNDEKLALYWCHSMFQFNCRPIEEGYALDIQVYQRSADVFLGVPYNIASYALLVEVMAKLVGMVPGELIHTFGDVHIYDNHQEGVEEQLSREPKGLPRLIINEDIPGDLKGIDPNGFELEGYEPYPGIKGKLSTGLR
jgi:thymidylate synthase